MPNPASAPHSPRVTRRLELLRRVDRETHDALLQAMPDLAAHLTDEGEVSALVDLLCQTSGEEPACALALVDRLQDLPPAVDAATLRRWALHGLQRWHTEPGRRLRHFEFEDPLDFRAGDAESDADLLLDCRGELRHYLAGFGFPECRFDLHEPQVAGQPPRCPAIGDGSMLLPRGFGRLAEADRHRLCRATAAHAAAHLRFSALGRPAGNRKPTLVALMSLIEDARVERRLAQSYPGLHALWGRFQVATRASSGFDFQGLAARLARALHDPSYADSNRWVITGRQLFEQASADLRDIAAFDRIARKLAVEMDKMRLPFVPARYRPMPVYRDDNSLLWNFNVPSVEDDRDSVVRERYEVKPLEFEDNEPEPMPAVDVDQRRRTRYPEWDCQLKALHENWATVIDAERAPAPVSGRARAHRAAHSKIRIPGLERIPDRSVRLRRLETGDELDLNAAIDSTISRRSRLAPDPRVFRRHGRRRRSTAIVLLMDLSRSTERFVPASFIKAIDAEKRAATMLAESLDGSRDRVAVHGFSSNGRHEVHYVCIKDFDEAFGPEQRARLACQEGQLSTRMGAALRHATHALGREQADRKLILMLTDGEPSDIDVYEDDYLVEDARHAVTSAAAQGVKTFCLTLDRHGAHVRRIFGERNYLIADKAASFAGRAGQALVKLIAQ